MKPQMTEHNRRRKRQHGHSKFFQANPPLYLVANRFIKKSVKAASSSAWDT